MYYAYLLIDQKSYGIVNTWEECKLKVSGINAKYHKFKDHAAALAWGITEIKNRGGHINIPEVNPQKDAFGDTPGVICCDKDGESYIPVSKILKEEGYEED